MERMKTLLFWLGAVPAILALVVLTAGGAFGQSVPCGDRTKIIDRLKNVYSEEPVSIGVTVNGAIIEVYVSEEGTFTVLVTNPNGSSCLISSGENWEQLPVVTVERRINL